MYLFLISLDAKVIKSTLESFAPEEGRTQGHDEAVGLEKGHFSKRGTVSFGNGARAFGI
jgi:hypothetical protein